MAYGIFAGSKMLEGGFSSKQAAENYLQKEYLDDVELSEVYPGQTLVVKKVGR